MAQQSALFALAANQHLANAPDWSCFKINDSAAVVNAAAAVAGSQPSELLHALAPVLSRGMQLLSEQQLDVATLRQHEQGVEALVLLCIGRQEALAALERHTARERVLVSLAVQMTRTGMIKAYGQLCRTLARFISSPATHGAAAAAAFKRIRMPQLIVQLMLLLSNVVEDWPGNKALSNPAVAAAVPAVAELAVAALRNTNTHWTHGSSSSSSQQPRVNAAHAATAVAAAICLGSISSVDGQLAFVPDHVAASSAVMQLLLACLAMALQAIHQRQQGLAAAAAGSAGAADHHHQQQQLQLAAVPAYHQQLLDALGVAEAADLLLDKDAALLEGMLQIALCGVRSMRFQRPPSNGSSSAATAGQQQAGAAVDASLLAPLLFALLECCALLLPDQATAAACLTTMEQLSAHFGDCIPDSLARDLPPAILQLLLPAIRAADAAAAAAAVAAVPAAPVGASAAGAPTSDLADCASSVLLALSASVADHAEQQRCEDWPADSTVRAVAAAFLEQPQQYCALIEGPFRSVVASGVGRGQWASTVAALLLAATAYASSEGISLASGKQQQVFALLISCLKAVAADAAAMAAGAADPAEPEIARLLGTFRHVGQACALLLPRPSSSSSSSSSSSQQACAATAAGAVGPSSSLLAVHLLGRCLVAAGRAMHLASGVEPLLFREWLQGMQLLLADVAQQLQLLPAPAVPEPVVQQLLGEQAALQQQLQALLDQPAASAEAGTSAAAAASSDGLSGLGQQLEAFGAAVCAQAPVVHCCNHHLCSNTSQPSELELVGGKSCVCSGCRAARYCSRECQVAHYKSWHKAVCKRLQQR